MGIHRWPPNPRPKSNLINFTEKDVMKYLDGCIDHWRNIKETGNNYEKEIAVYYVDAFQTVRTSLFGETKS